MSLISNGVRGRAFLVVSQAAARTAEFESVEKLLTGQPPVSSARSCAGTTPTGSAAPRCRTPPYAPPARPACGRPAQVGSRTAPTTR